MTPPGAPLDELDRRIVVALQHDGRASWRAIADAVGSSVSTVSRRGQRLIDAGVVKVVVAPAVSARGPYETFWVRVNCAPGEVTAVAARFAAHEDVRFCAIVTGAYDLIAELVVRGGGAAHLPTIEGLRSIPGIERVRSDLIVHVHKVSFDWGTQLFGEVLEGEVGATTHAEPVVCGPEHFDDADEQILAMLASDGRETFQSIADRLGMHESSVRRRFDRMRASGCIDVLALVPSSALGMGAEVLLTITIAPARIEAVAEQLSAHPSVRYLALLLDESSLLCEVITPSVQDLHGFIAGWLARLEGVQGWTASMELLYLKRGFVETPWWRIETSSVR